MVDKSNTTFKWLPTKAIIIYNGTDNWNPLDDFRNAPHGDFVGSELPFECAFVDLKCVDDSLIVESETPEAAVGLLAMKYCHDMDAFSRSLDAIAPLLRKMPNEEGTTLVRKIELYLGEYLTNDAREKLNMAIKSLGERLGIVSAGDVRRAREREIRIESEKRGVAKGEARGFAKGEAMGLAKGREEERLKAEQKTLQSARDLIHKGVPLEIVVSSLRLTEEQVIMLH